MPPALSVGLFGARPHRQVRLAVGLDVVKRVDLAGIKVGSPEVPPERGEVNSLTGDPVEVSNEMVGAHPAGWVGGADAFEVESGRLLGLPVGEELAYEKPAGLGWEGEPSPVLSAGRRILRAEDNVDVSCGVTGKALGVDSEQLLDGRPTKVERHEGDTEVTGRTEVPGQTVRVGQINPGRLVEGVWVVLTALRRVNPCQLGEVDITSLDTTTNGSV